MRETFLTTVAGTAVSLHQRTRSAIARSSAGGSAAANPTDRVVSSGIAATASSGVVNPAAYAPLYSVTVVVDVGLPPGGSLYRLDARTASRG